MKRTIVFWFVVVALSLVAAPEPLMAQCMECKAPPPHTAFQCGNTFFNAADGCLISVDRNYCMTIGQCVGDAGDPCTLRCPLEKWACGGKPLSEDWRLVRVAVRVAPAGSTSGIPENRGSV